MRSGVLLRHQDRCAKCKLRCELCSAGHHLGDGGAWMLPRLVGRSKAMELAFTADPIDAETAQRIQLVSAVADDDRLQHEAMALAKRIARHPPNAMRMHKRLLRESEQLSLQNHLDLVAAFQAIAHMAPEHLGAVGTAVAALERRASRRT
nr:enoyl-CoA hydratase-related protein [Diaphorobacter aerolatus]